MTIRVSVTHHEAEGAPVLAEVFAVDPYGHVLDTPVRRQSVPPGVTATLHLHAGNVLVVRPAADDEAVA